MTDEYPHHPKPQADAAVPSVSPAPAAPTDAADEPLRLDHFLKLSAVSESGGQAKLMIQGGEVKVNGEVETRRRRKLRVGDVVEFGGKSYHVAKDI